VKEILIAVYWIKHLKLKNIVISLIPNKFTQIKKLRKIFLNLNVIANDKMNEIRDVMGKANNLRRKLYHQEFEMVNKLEKTADEITGGLEMVSIKQSFLGEP
jgi:hypothetical protein